MAEQNPPRADPDQQQPEGGRPRWRAVSVYVQRMRAMVSRMVGHVRRLVGGNRRDQWACVQTPLLDRRLRDRRLAIRARDQQAASQQATSQPPPPPPPRPTRALNFREQGMLPQRRRHGVPEPPQQRYGLPELERRPQTYGGGTAGVQPAAPGRAQAMEQATAGLSREHRRQLLLMVEQMDIFDVETDIDAYLEARRHPRA